MSLDRIPGADIPGLIKLFPWSLIVEETQQRAMEVPPCLLVENILPRLLTDHISKNNTTTPFHDSYCDVPMRWASCTVRDRGRLSFNFLNSKRRTTKERSKVYRQMGKVPEFLHFYSLATGKLEQHSGYHSKLSRGALDPDEDDMYSVAYDKQGNTMYLGVWEAADEDELVLGSNLFGLWEGLFDGKLEIHRFFLCSPKILVVLRHNLLRPEHLNMAKSPPYET
jgi:hypothetical protein